MSADLCRRCGLCCDGTLFDRVPLREGEVVPEPVRASVCRGSLAQRCAALGSGGCGVYEARPLACRRFDCLLLSALRDAEVGLDEALAVVAGTRERLARLAAQVAPGDGPVLRRARASPATQRCAADLEEHLRFHFTGQRPAFFAPEPRT